MSILCVIKSEVELLIKNAEENVIVMTPQNYKTLKPVGNNPDFVALMGTVRVVYSIEKQPSGKLRHLSISLPLKDDKTRPAPIVVTELMKAFGFDPNLENCDGVWNEGKAINVIQMYDKGKTNG